MKQCVKCESNNAKKWYSGPKCEKCYRKEWYENNKNTKKQKERKSNYYKENKDIITERSAKWAENNRERHLEAKKQWYHTNKHKLPDRTEKYKKYYNDRYNNDIQFKLKINLRNRLNNAIKNQQKTGSAVSDLGCTVSELKKHLESQFKPGMSWDNWCKDGWHIDHIKPLDSFNLENREELLEACNYKNLQPLWAEDNFKKSNSI